MLAAYGLVNSRRPQSRADGFGSHHRGHLKEKTSQQRLLSLQGWQAAGRTGGPLVWRLGETVLQGEHAFSVLGQLPAALRKHVCTAEVAGAARDIVGRRGAACAQEADAEQMPGALVAVVEGQQPLGYKESVCDEVVVERIPDHLPEMLVDVWLCPRRCHHASTRHDKTLAKLLQNSSRPLAGPKSRVRDCASLFWLSQRDDQLNS
jgi:hypothetical protein